MIYRHHDYASSGDFTDLAVIVDEAVKDLRNHTRSFDSIACTGISGITVAAPVALRLHKNLIVVRKPGDKAHSCSFVEGKGKRYVFLDDFINTGKTVRRVGQKLADEKTLGFDPPQRIGRYTYHDRQWNNDITGYSRNYE